MKKVFLSFLSTVLFFSSYAGGVNPSKIKHDSALLKQPELFTPKAENTFNVVLPPAAINGVAFWSSTSPTVLTSTNVMANGVLVTGTGQLPAISTTLPNGITATTQTATDNSTKIATDAFVLSQPFSKDTLNYQSLWTTAWINVNNFGIQRGYANRITNYTAIKNLFTSTLPTLLNNYNTIHIYWPCDGHDTSQIYYDTGAFVALSGSFDMSALLPLPNVTGSVQKEIYIEGSSLSGNNTGKSYQGSLLYCLNRKSTPHRNCVIGAEGTTSPYSFTNISLHILNFNVGLKPKTAISAILVPLAQRAEIRNVSVIIDTTAILTTANMNDSSVGITTPTINNNGYVNEVENCVVGDNFGVGYEIGEWGAVSNSYSTGNKVGWGVANNAQPTRFYSENMAYGCSVGIKCIGNSVWASSTTTNCSVSFDEMTFGHINKTSGWPFYPLYDFQETSVNQANGTMGWRTNSVPGGATGVDTLIVHSTSGNVPAKMIFQGLDMLGVGKMQQGFVGVCDSADGGERGFHTRYANDLQFSPSNTNPTLYVLQNSAGTSAIAEVVAENNSTHKTAVGMTSSTYTTNGVITSDMSYFPCGGANGTLFSTTSGPFIINTSNFTTANTMMYGNSTGEWTLGLGSTTNTGAWINAISTNATHASINLIVSSTDKTTYAAGDLTLVSQKLKFCPVGTQPDGFSLIGFTSTSSASDTNTTAETSLIGTVVGSKTLPAGAFGAAGGKTLEIDVVGYYTSGTAQTITIKVKLGSTVVCTTGSVTQPTGQTQAGFKLRCFITCRTTGAGGSVMGWGEFVQEGSILTTSQMQNVSTVAINTNNSQVIDVTATEGAITNTIVGTIAIGKILN